MKKSTIKNALLAVAAIAILGIAGRMDYTEEVIYSMPQCVYDSIRAHLGTDATDSEIAEEYMDHRAHWDKVAKDFAWSTPSD